MAEIVGKVCVQRNATGSSTDEGPVEYYLHERYKQPGKTRGL